MNTTLDAIRKAAQRAANDYEFQWEQLDTSPILYDDLTSRLKVAVENANALEDMYKKIDSGESVIIPDEPTTLTAEQVEYYKNIVINKLYHAYMWKDIHDRLMAIESITKQ